MRGIELNSGRIERYIKRGVIALGVWAVVFVIVAFGAISGGVIAVCIFSSSVCDGESKCGGRCSDLRGIAVVDMVVGSKVIFAT